MFNRRKDVKIETKVSLILCILCFVNVRLKKVTFCPHVLSFSTLQRLFSPRSMNRSQNAFASLTNGKYNVFNNNHPYPLTNCYIIWDKSLKNVYVLQQ